MSIYEINFKDLTRKTLPPDKRGPNFRSWVAALTFPLQWLRDLVLGDYRVGSSGQPWIITTEYQTGDRVTYNGSAYDSLIDNNLGNPPTDVIRWVLVQQNFIGVAERALYNGNLLIFTYAINKYFSTVFRQPPNISDIYIEAHPKPLSAFIIGETEPFSSVVFTTSSSEFIINEYNFNTYVNMTIYVPQVKYDSLDTDPLNREKIIRNFADKYIVAGINYSVQPY